jgi:cytochrome c556
MRNRCADRAITRSRCALYDALRTAHADVRLADVLHRRSRARSRWMKMIVVMILFAASAAMADGRHLPAPPLSMTARALIHQKMANHAKQMTELVWAVIFLDFDQAARQADAIATEPRFARPASGDATELNTALPPRFFELQDQLRQRAQLLEAVARTRDASAVAKSYGALAESCVSCHAVYLNPR